MKFWSNRKLSRGMNVVMSGNRTPTSLFYSKPDSEKLLEWIFFLTSYNIWMEIPIVTDSQNDTYCVKSSSITAKNRFFDIEWFIIGAAVSFFQRILETNLHPISALRQLTTIFKHIWKIVKMEAVKVLLMTTEKKITLKT